MNKLSTQGAFSISPSVTGNFKWIENTMIFTPGSALSSNTAYTCAVGTNAEDMTGNSIASAYGWHFNTGVAGTIAPTVIMVSPSDNSTQISVSSVVSVTFSESMNQSSAQSAFSISPSVSGVPNWDGNTMTFTPGSALSTDTTYACTVGTGAKDQSGNPMTAAYSWNFTTILTVAPTVVSISPADGATGVPVTISALSVTFSQPMDTSSLKESADPIPEGTNSWDETNKILTFTLSANLLPSKTYTFSVRAENVAGTYMVTPKVWSFTTGP